MTKPARLFSRLAPAVLALGLAAGISGCTGNSDDRFEYVSTAYSPKTLSVVDVRTDETIWTYEVPVGSELRLNFSPDRTEYGAIEPSASMRYKVFPAGEQGEIPVPAKANRRLDLELRDGPEEAPAPRVEPVVPAADDDGG